MHQQQDGTFNGAETFQVLLRHEGQIGHLTGKTEHLTGELKHLRQQVSLIRSGHAPSSSTPSTGVREIMKELAPWVSGVVVLVLALMQRWDLVQKFLDFN